MSSDFKIDIQFEAKPPRLKELINKALMGDVWIRDTPFGPVTDSIVVAKKFGLTHYNVLRAISKVHTELGGTKKF
jgi:phage regulator Rha-like protein